MAEAASTSYPVRAPLHPAKAQKSHLSGRGSAVTLAYTAGATAFSHPDRQYSGKERLLRYPDGRVRCIRYPKIAAEAERQAEQTDPTVSYEEDWDPDRWDDIDWAWEVLSTQNAAGAGRSSTAFVSPLPEKADPPQKVQAWCSELANFVKQLYCLTCFECFIIAYVL